MWRLVALDRSACFRTLQQYYVFSISQYMYHHVLYLQVVVLHDLIKGFSTARNPMHNHCPVMSGNIRDMPSESCCQIDNKVG